MNRACPVCDQELSDGDRVVAVMLSTYKAIDSDVHYAITTPTKCLEILHHDCYDFPNDECHSEMDS